MPTFAIANARTSQYGKIGRRGDVDMPNDVSSGTVDETTRKKQPTEKKPVCKDTRESAPKGVVRVRDSDDPAAARRKTHENFIRNRVNDFYLAYEHKLPRLSTLGIDLNAKALTPRQQTVVARHVQSGLVARVVLRHARDTTFGVPESMREKECEEILALIYADGKIDIDNLTRDEVMRVRRVADTGTQARDIFTKMNIGLVTILARREQKKRNLDTYTYDEILEESKFGMLNAIDRFDPDAGFKFSTYATWWVRQKIMDYLNVQSKLIKMPANMNTLYRRITVAMKDLRQVYPSDEKITPDVIYEWMEERNWGVSKRQIIDALAVRKETISIDAFVSDDDTRTIDDTIASDEDVAESTAEAIDTDASFERLVSMISNDETRDIIREIYQDGDAGNAKEVGEIARRHGMTTREVQNRIAQAISDMKRTIEFSTQGNRGE
jgi:RNA polymerase primary sigma factor